MANEEIIEKGRTCLRASSCARCEYCYCNFSPQACMHGIINDLCNALEEAEKKKKPVKPKVYKAHPIDLYLCGNCGSTFIRSTYNVKMAFCPVCGTENDWSEEEKMEVDYGND